jgi:RNA polymerase sigma-70 factor, ECF subfamily
VGCFRGHVLQVLTLDGDRIAEVTGFVEPALFDRFGLPATLR